MRIRAPSPDDAEALADVGLAGFESYREFAPPGYRPPDRAHEIGMFREALAAQTYWARVAEDDAGVVGHVGFHRREIEPGLVHFQRLFLMPRAWGSGLGGRLHALAIEEMRRCGFERARLFTPAGHERARRFYEREGWSVHGEEFPEPRLGGLPLVEYRRAV